ncbi:MAG: hypothetical protein ACRQFF_02945 [Sphaerochaeta sp.]
MYNILKKILKKNIYVIDIISFLDNDNYNIKGDVELQNSTSPFFFAKESLVILASTFYFKDELFFRLEFVLLHHATAI